ncbi:MAG: tetratricopeptide repeat protein [Proteobacteria bacterium]|nr:tetratricopeptide repeat protein [Pseudomonadota bacterium]
MALSSALLITGCGDRTKQAYAEAARAQALLDTGDLMGAQMAIAHAITLRGDQMEFQLLNGRINFQRKDYQGAFEAYSLALSIDPMNPEALQAVSQIGAAMGRERESAEATDRILSVEPNNLPALLVKGVELLGKRDLAGAQKIGERMLQVDPKNEAGLVLKARAMFLNSQQPEALALLRDALKQNGPSQMLVTALLECARDQSDSDVMLQQFRALGELVPDNVDLTIDEANVDYKLGRRDDAHERVWALLTKNGGNRDAMDRLNDLWAEYETAPLDRNQIASLAADGAAPARLMTARFYLFANDARTAAELVGSLPGAEADGLRARIVYVQSGGSDAAAANRVLAADKNNCDALAVRATDAIRRGQPTAAVNAAQEVASQCPDRDGYDLLARAYNAKGDAAGVRRAFLDGTRARPLDTKPVAQYAAWLVNTGNANEAVDVARRLTQRAPAKISGWRLLGGLCARSTQTMCAEEAKAGEAAARKSFVIDLPPGERRPNPLLGSRWR